MSKLTFKRLALVVVTALGLGVLSSGPSLANFTNSSDTLTLSSTTASITVGETASVTVSVSGIAGAAADSLTVNVATQSYASGLGDGSLGMYITDSSNAQIRTAAWEPLGGSAKGTNWSGTRQYDDYDSAAVGVNVSAGMGSRKVADSGAGSPYKAYVGATGAAALSATFSLRFIAPTVAGTYVFRVYNSLSGGTVGSVPLTWTVTVAASTAGTSDLTKSVVYMNRTTEYTTSTGYAANPSSSTYKGLEADSALVVSAGTAATPVAQAVIFPVVKNSSDTKVTTVAQVTDASNGASASSRIKDSVTVVISGPGLLGVSSYWTGTVGTKAKQVIMDWKESVVVYSDGSAGVGTITSYLGSGTPTSATKLSQAAKTITFVGRATTFTVSAGTAAVRAGSTISYTGATTDTNGGDSVTAGTNIVRFLAADAAGNNVSSAALNVDQGEGAFYAISSDTSVVAAGSTAAARKSPALACTYSATTTYWSCSGNVYDSGTVTFTIVDSRTVTPNGANYLTSTTSAVAKSAAFSISISGAGYAGTIKLDKASYSVGDAATLTLTCKDAAGNVIADGKNTTCFTNLNWAGPAPTFSTNSSVNASGGTFTDLAKFVAGTDTTNNNTYTAGVDTALVYMPTVAGTYTLKGRTSGATTDSTLLTFTVTDPVQAAQNTAISNAQAAADAATDAALQAIDAANAATDAANLAAEAADAATVAAQESKDAADAATAAVESLATQVATLMAALQAQITSLANVVAKIAKKVKA